MYLLSYKISVNKNPGLKSRGYLWQLNALRDYASIAARSFFIAFFSS